MLGFLVASSLASAASAMLAPPARSVVIGGGPSGLLTAISLRRRGFANVEVLDRLPPPPQLDDEAAWDDTARFYLIGLNGRGERALKRLGVWAAVVPLMAPVRGRQDWAPGAGADGGILTLRGDRPPTNVIARDRLVACLLGEALACGVTVTHDVDVEGVRWEDDAAGNVVLRVRDAAGERDVVTPFLVGCDGAKRTVGDAMEADAKLRPGGGWFGRRRFKIVKYPDTSVRVYKTVPFRPPPGWRGDINYSARTSAANFDALPALNGDYCGVMLIKPDDALSLGLPNLQAARAYFDANLPAFSPWISDASLEAVVKKPPSRLPVFRYAGPDLHRGGNTVLLGDAIHSVKPYFGLGANSAFEDLDVLDEALDSAATLGQALEAYSLKRAPEARVLVQISRSFDYAGLRGFMTFIFPLIIDGIFHGKVSSKIFAPNMLALLQNPTLSFSQVLRRKRIDRVLQGATVAAACAVAFSALKAAALAGVRTLAAVDARYRAAVSLGLAVAAAAAVRAATSKGAPLKGDVADVLATQTSPDKARPSY
ncbi:hypothetical protein M885DRAFT_552926 [Pelagophyceae sp. CCMP2097]|nr:hypothetical protein M885DRAFT_552926 [Pelagophyceae sp. CCMP2097]